MLVKVFLHEQLAKQSTQELKRTFSQKQNKKYNSKTQVDEKKKKKKKKKKSEKKKKKKKKKNLPFHDILYHLVFLYFSLLYIRRRLPYIIKVDSSEGL